MAEKNEIEVQHQFKDSISDIKMKHVSPNNAYCAFASWDGQILVYTLSAEGMNP